MGALVRVAWFLLVGWWLGPLWFILSVILMGSIIFFPIGAYAASKTWTIMTFKSSPTVVVKNVQAEAN
jgi:uncharacterized membrane protein YccF (DUF307 family)